MGTNFTGSTEDRRTLDAYIKLIRASDTVLGHVSKTFTEHNLTLSQYGVLDALYHLGPMCQSTLARKILRSSGNMTMVIDNLEKRNLVRRVRAEQDRRKFMVELTDEGSVLIQAVMPGHVERVREAFSVLDEDEQLQLCRLTRKLGLALVERENAHA